MRLPVLALVMIIFSGCGTFRGFSTRAAPEAKNDKEIAACERMCAVAGDTEHNEDAVAACIKDCRNR